MAEALAAQYARDNGKDWICRSAGIFASPGAPISENARRALKKCGVENFSHSAVPLTRALIEEADLVIAMTPDHAAYIRQGFGGGDKVIAMPDPVGDPYGGGEETYDTSCLAIRAGIEKLAKAGILP